MGYEKDFNVFAFNLRVFYKSKKFLLDCQFKGSFCSFFIENLTAVNAEMNVFDFYREKQEHEENLAKALIESKKETTKVLNYIKTADRVLFDDTENIRRIKQELEIKKIQDKSRKINIQNAVNLYTEHRELFDRCSERFGTPAARDYSDLNSEDAEICETINNILDKNNNSLFNQKNTYYFKDMKKGYYIESESGNLNKWNLNSNDETLLTIADTWTVDATHYYAGCHSKLSSDGKMLTIKPVAGELERLVTKYEADFNNAFN